MNSISRQYIFLIPAGILLALTFSNCSKKKAPPAPPPPEVTLVHPIKREITEWNDYTGRLRSPEAVEVRPRVGGYLESIHFEDGQMIKKGDLLFVIDPRSFQADLNAAKAAVSQADAQGKLAEANFSRSVDLRKKGVVAQENFDTNANNLTVANGTITSAKAGLTNAELNLSYTRITAPVSGKIGRHQISVGNLVNANTSLLTTIVSLDPIYCYFEMDEQSYLKSSEIFQEQNETSKKPVEVQMELTDEQNYPHHGALDFIDNRLDNDTATIEMRGVFENPNRTLTPGLFARVRLPAKRKHEVVLIPDEAVGSDQALQFVYVVGADNKAQRHTVELGPLAEGLRVVRKGVSPEDRIIAVGVVKVQPGAEVKPMESSIAEMNKQAEPEENVEKKLK